MITVGSFDFTESVVLAEVYSQALEEAGFQVERAFDLGPREFVGPALDGGLVELLPEYAGTAAEFHSLGAAEPTDDVAPRTTSSSESIAGSAAPRAGGCAGAGRQHVRRDRGDGGASRTSPPSATSPTSPDELTFGGPAECPSRATSAWRDWPTSTALQFDEFVALDAGGPLTHQALLGGRRRRRPAVHHRSLDRRPPDLVELTDDRGLQPAENITPLVRAEVVDRWGDGVVAGDRRRVGRS